jgi:hypothetical protein
MTIVREAEAGANNHLNGNMEVNACLDGSEYKKSTSRYLEETECPFQSRRDWARLSCRLLNTCVF